MYYIFYKSNMRKTKMSMKEVKEYINKWRYNPCLLLGRLKVVKDVCSFQLDLYL